MSGTYIFVDLQVSLGILSALSNATCHTVVRSQDGPCVIKTGIVDVSDSMLKITP